jgi:hypothetical protein
MRGLILIFLVVIVAGGVTGASASDGPRIQGPGAQPPSVPSDVTCSTDVAAMRQLAEQSGIQLPARTPDGTKVCFYPEHAR